MESIGRWRKKEGGENFWRRSDRSRMFLRHIGNRRVLSLKTIKKLYRLDQSNLFSINPLESVKTAPAIGASAAKSLNTKSTIGRHSQSKVLASAIPNRSAIV
jgi:hypothetical protein